VDFVDKEATKAGIRNERRRLDVGGVDTRVVLGCPSGLRIFVLRTLHVDEKLIE